MWQYDLGQGMWMDMYPDTSAELEEAFLARKKELRVFDPTAEVDILFDLDEMTQTAGSKRKIRRVLVAHEEVKEAEG